MLRVKVFENPESITDGELAGLAARLTPECRARAQRYKYRSGRAQSLVADGLLLDLVGEVTGASALPQCGVADAGVRAPMVAQKRTRRRLSLSFSWRSIYVGPCRMGGNHG